MKLRRHAHFIVAFLILLVILAWASLDAQAQSDPDFPRAVAARCKGESAYAIGECACTVRNRLLAGWSQNRVLDAYFAEDVEPVPAEIWLAGYYLKDCRPDLWFMFSGHDVAVLGLDYELPLLSIYTPVGSVRFFARDVFEKGE